MNYDYDLFVIGAGSGGVRASRISASLGAKVAVAESLYVGGTCVNVGCVPKKLFVYAAQFAEDFHHAAGFGWDVSEVRFNWARLLENKDKEILRLNGIYQNLLQKSGVDFIPHRAELTGLHTVLCNGKEYTCKNILIATGGWPHVPEFPGSEHVITSNEMFYLERIPSKALVVGGGYIGVEFAGILKGLGSKTVLSYRGELFLKGFERTLREFVRDEMLKKEIDLRFNSQVNSIEKVTDGLSVTFADGSIELFDCVLYATGRKPNTINLGLEKAGVMTDASGAVMVNEEFKTNIEHIYAVGDVIDRVQLTPVALAEGMYVAHTLFGKGFRKVDYEFIPTAVFTQPELATVGYTEERARKEFLEDVEIFKGDFRPMKHTLSGSSERTVVKMVVRKSDQRVLGLHMGGLYSAEIIQGMAVALKAGATKEHFDSTIGIHPTSAEEFVTMR